jgi:hypothetical protein
MAYKVRVLNGDGIEAAAHHQQEWCSALVDGHAECGSQFESDPQVYVFCDEECATEFAQRLAETEPEATAIGEGRKAL